MGNEHGVGGVGKSEIRRQTRLVPSGAREGDALDWSSHGRHGRQWLDLIHTLCRLDLVGEEKRRESRIMPQCEHLLTGRRQFQICPG